MEVGEISGGRGVNQANQAYIKLEVDIVFDFSALCVKQAWKIWKWTKL